MAAKGAKAKEEILKKIQEIFPGAFIHEKVLRIPMEENGDTVEIKVTLTAAKDCITQSKNLSFSSESQSGEGLTPLPWNNFPEEPTNFTPEEEKTITDLAKVLGF